MNPLLQQAGQASLHLYDSELQKLIESSLNWLEQMPALANRYCEQMSQGASLANCIGLEKSDLDARYSAAFSLCERDEFLLALPLALHCCSAHAGNAQYAFLAGSCLQRLGIHDYAAMMFRHSLQIDEGHMPAAYRLGECLLALGDREAATHLFKWAVELGRLDPAYRGLQDLALSRLARISPTN